MSPKSAVFLATIAVTVALDQLTKWLVAAHLAPYSDEIVLIPGFLSIIHARNTGATAGLLSDFEYRIWLFLGFAVVAAGIVVDLWRRLPRSDRFHSLTLGLILAGAVGNAIDRARAGEVIDFIRMYTELPAARDWLVERFGTAEWPTYNVADSALVVGVGLFLVHYLFLEEQPEEPPPEPPTREE